MTTKQHSLYRCRFTPAIGHPYTSLLDTLNESLNPPCTDFVYHPATYPSNLQPRLARRLVTLQESSQLFRHPFDF